MYRAFSSICETRTLSKAGYVRFRDFWLYGERGLAGKKVLINIFPDTLALEYGEYPLAKYAVEGQPDDTHLRRVGNPRLYDHPYQSTQLELWPTGSVEWFVIIRAAPYGAHPRRKRGRLVFLQTPLFLEGDGTQQSQPSAHEQIDGMSRVDKVPLLLRSLWGVCGLRIFLPARATDRC
jgi:hypothetical protein